ncbi:MAG: GumC family protein, partial [Verrucomicrobiales bacterium]
MEAPKFKANINNSNNQADTKLHFLDYWRIIRIRKTVILAVFLLVVLTTTAVTFVLPETYMSFARIEVNKDSSGVPGLLQIQQSSTIDPYFINTEFEKIKSQKVLERVIQNLRLTEVWAKKYKTESLKMSEVYAMLSRQIDVRQFRNTSLIEIRAYSDDKNEAAAIAQKIAEVYQQTRLEVKRSQSEAGVAALKEEYAKQQEFMEEKQKVVDDLRQQLQISDIGSDAMMFQSTLEPEVVRTIQKTVLDADSRYTHWNTLLQGLKSMDKAALRRAIPTSMPDSALEKLLSDLAQAEQRYEIT